ICYDKFLTLNEEQQIAYEKISQYNIYKSFLLEGVTGSGKTEIFLHLIRDVIERGESVIVLVPEIALTRQTEARFVERFGNRVALTHSKMTPKTRRKIYLQAKKGEVQIIIGPRSALFMPLPKLSLIIIDEEHDGSYKSESTPKFNAIEVAMWLMKQNNGKLILASATPSMETYYQATINQIEYIKLTKRAGNAVMPDISIIDMRLEMDRGNMNIISRALHIQIEYTLKSNKQVMLLLNRRGHSTFINCRACGFVVKCEQCNLPFTYHQKQNILLCHHCLNQAPVPSVCPKCNSVYIRFFGNGTQKIEEYLNHYFSDFGIGRMDLDTTSKKNELENILQNFEQKKINILIGTQMISKGHDFSNVTLVGIISADSLLYIEDFRANERTYQLITQTLGRSGRGTDKGKVIIQTYSPNNDVILDIKNNNQVEFYKNELCNRKILGYPPFSHLFSVLISSETENITIASIKKLFAYYLHYNKKKLFKLLGPVQASIPKIANRYRWKITIMGLQRDILLLYGRFCIDKFTENEDTSQINISWDIDPKNMI
ncbi:primosomal protein N', partial [Candidatus Epulonipiscioides gigas]